MTKTNIEQSLPPIVKFLVAVLDHRRQCGIEKLAGLNLGKAKQLRNSMAALYNKLNEPEQKAANSLMTDYDEPEAWHNYMETFCTKHPKYERLFMLINEEHFFFLPEEKWFKPHTARHYIVRKQYPDWYLWLREID